MTLLGSSTLNSFSLIMIIYFIILVVLFIAAAIFLVHVFKRNKKK